MADAAPDTIVIVTPHGTMVEGHVSVLDGPAINSVVLIGDLRTQLPSPACLGHLVSPG